MYIEESSRDTYTIENICLITGLTDRTIRSYISMGVLKGEKIKGVWHFTPEEVDAFIRHPTVRPSLQAKRNGYVYDFLVNPAANQDRCCMIVDFPGQKGENVSHYFCEHISNDDYYAIDFSFDGTNEPRVILRGNTREVLRLINGYYSQL